MGNVDKGKGRRRTFKSFPEKKMIGKEEKKIIKKCATRANAKGRQRGIR